MKRILALGQRCGLSSRRLSQLSTERSKSAVEPEIVIPKRIPRGPTDILRALESTIHRDPTAPDYKFIDDPYLIPASSFEKRALALSKESGRSAARYMLENFPECFKNNPAEPSIAQFNPGRPPFKEGEENSEEDLSLCIDELDVAQALLVYDNLQRTSVEVTQGTLLKLLQLVSFYNGKPPPNSALVEERFLSRSMTKATNTWEAGGAAEQIFEKIENKDAEAYSALISGVLRYSDSERGLKMYEEMRSKNLVPSLHVYNNLILNTRRLRDNAEEHTKLLMRLLEEMRDFGVQPDLITFNNAVYSITRFGRNAPLFSKILGEMRHLNIEPSLATYHHVLQGLYKRGRVVHVMNQIMDRVSGQTWEVRDPADFRFLIRAMEVASDFEADKELAYRVLDLAEENPHLMNNALTQSLFFQHFFKLLAETEDIDKLMLVYNRLVPNTYSPEPAIVSEILKAIEVARAYRYLPHMWSDMLLMRHNEREDLLKQMLTLTAAAERSTTKESESVQDQCVVIARDIQTRVRDINEQRDRSFRLPIVLDAQMISHMLQTYMNADNLDFAADTLEYLIKNQRDTPGVIPADILMKLAEKACEAQRKPMALACAKYSAEIGHDSIVAFVKEKAVELDFGEEFLQQLGPSEA